MNQKPTLNKIILQVPNHPAWIRAFLIAAAGFLIPNHFSQASQLSNTSLQVEIGLGLARYEIQRHSLSNISLIGTQLRLAARADRAMIQQSQSQIPYKHRAFANRLSSVSFTHPLIPRSIYFGSTDEDIKAFGGTWGITPGVSKSFTDFKLKAAGGVIAHVIYLEDQKQDLNDLFIRPGLRLESSLSFPRLDIWSRPWRLNLGVLGDLFIPQKLLSPQESYSLHGVFFQIETEFPYSK